MKQSTNLPDILCDLYQYSERLKTEFQNEVEKEAVHLAAGQATGDQAESLRSVRNGGLGVLDLCERDPDAFALFRDCEKQAEGNVRERHSPEPTPHEKSLAWLSAAQWVGRHVSSSLENAETKLKVYCAQCVVGRDGDRLGARMKHRLWQKEQGDQSFRLLQTEITRLDTPDKIDELLRLLWDRCPTEARIIGLPNPKKPGRVRRTLVWVRDHIVPTVIARVLRALFAWLGLG